MTTIAFAGANGTSARSAVENLRRLQQSQTESIWQRLSRSITDWWYIRNSAANESTTVDAEQDAVFSNQDVYFPFEIPSRPSHPPDLHSFEDMAASSAKLTQFVSHVQSMMDARPSGQPAMSSNEDAHYPLAVPFRPSYLADPRTLKNTAASSGPTTEFSPDSADDMVLKLPSPSLSHSERSVGGSASFSALPPADYYRPPSHPDESTGLAAQAPQYYTAHHPHHNPVASAPHPFAPPLFPLTLSFPAAPASFSIAPPRPPDVPPQE